MRVKSALLIAALAAYSSVHANDVRTGVGGAAGAVVGGAMTADSKPKTQTQTQTQTSGAPQPLRTTTGPTYYDSESCNRNNPGKGKAKGHCKH